MERHLNAHTLYRALSAVAPLHPLIKEATTLFLPIYNVAVFLQKDIHRFKIQQMIPKRFIKIALLP